MAGLLSRLPSIDYPPAQDGRWSPITSTLDWCEENYVVTQYSAEIVNTLTNLLFMYLAAKGIRNCLQHGHDMVFLVSFVGYLLVGIGSFLFHSTLKYPMQLVDELSMIYTTCLMSYATFSHGKSRRYSTALAVGLVSLSLFITVYYHYLQDPTFHQYAYAILTIVVLLRSIYVMEVHIRARFRSKHRPKHRGTANPQSYSQEMADQEQDALRDEQILHTMWQMIVFGLGIFLSGAAFWHWDNKHCSKLIQWRRKMGLPWGFVLEGHGWWHLLTGTGAYYFIVWGIWLRHCLNSRQEEYELVWPNVWTMPCVVRRRNGTVDGRAGGLEKKGL